MIESSQTLSAIAAACLILSASVQGAVAQQSKTLGGRIIGEAEWQRITPAASEFDVTSPHHFMVRKKSFPSATRNGGQINAARAMAHDLLSSTND